MNAGKMKAGLCIVLLVFLSIGVSLAQTDAISNFDMFIAEFEPTAYERLSAQEKSPFASVEIDPTELKGQIAQSETIDDIVAVFHSKGINLPPEECAWLDYYKNLVHFAQYPLQNSQEIATLSYGDNPSNLVFIFVNDGNGYVLTDYFIDFYNIKIVTDATMKNVWMVGDTGIRVPRSIQWYNVKCKQFVLSYLANGTMADRMDYHILVQSVADPIIDGMLPANDRLVIRKQVSILDFLNAPSSEEAQTIVFYTQIDVYTAQAEGDFKKIASQRYEGMDFSSVADITCDQIISKDEKRE